MLAVANYLMKGPKQAYGLATLLAVLTIWFAPVGLLWGASIVLVTLRISPIEGAKLFALTTLVHIALTLPLLGSVWPGVIATAEYALPAWVFALVLRQTQSLAQTLTGITAFVGAMVLVFHFAVGDPAQWWLQILQTVLTPILDQAQMDFPKESLQQFANMLTFLLGMFIVMLWFGVVLLGRWWQSRLYYPGKFQQDFYQLVLPTKVAYAAIALSVMGLIWPEMTLLTDLTGVLMAALMFQGLAIAHARLAQTERSKAWLFGVYTFIFLFPQTILILATIALLDIWLDFRQLNGQPTDSE